MLMIKCKTFNEERLPSVLNLNHPPKTNRRSGFPFLQDIIIVKHRQLPAYSPATSKTSSESDISLSISKVSLAGKWEDRKKNQNKKLAVREFSSSR